MYVTVKQLLFKKYLSTCTTQLRGCVVYILSSLGYIT